MSSKSFVLKFKPETWPQCALSTQSPDLEVTSHHKDSDNRTDSLCVSQQSPNSYLRALGPRKCSIEKIYVLFCYTIWDIISLIWFSFLKCGYNVKARKAVDHRTARSSRLPLRWSADSQTDFYYLSHRRSSRG